MKKIILSSILLVSTLFSTLSAQSAKKKAEEETLQWRYELQASVGQAQKGSAIVRVWTYSPKVQIATLQAGKNAVHGMLFVGVAPSNDHLRLPGVPAIITDPTIETEHEAYF